jgi:hypothetical protein
MFKELSLLIRINEYGVGVFTIAIRSQLCRSLAKMILLKADKTEWSHNIPHYHILKKEFQAKGLFHKILDLAILKQGLNTIKKGQGQQKTTTKRTFQAISQKSA